MTISQLFRGCPGRFVNISPSQLFRGFRRRDVEPARSLPSILVSLSGLLTFPLCWPGFRSGNISLPVPTYARLPRDHFTSMCNKVKHLQVFSQLVTHQMISVMAIWVSVMIIQLAPGYKRETWYSKYIAVPRLSVDRRLRVVLDVLDDQCKEPMVNIKDHLVGQLTMVQQCTLVLQLFVLSRTQSY